MPPAMKVSHVVGFDDAPFERTHRGDVLVVGAVYAGERLDGVLSCKVRRDGANATARLIGCMGSSRFHAQLHVVLLQGIAFGGFNVVDIHALHDALERPVLVISRRRPDLASIRRALLEHVPGGRAKWRLIEQAGPMEPMEGLHVQRAGLSVEDARRVLVDTRVHAALPEPLRAAHLIAAGVVRGESRHRA
jgi:uncharacterized protein